VLRHISTYLDLSTIFRAANMQHGGDGVSEHSENSAKSQPEAVTPVNVSRESSKETDEAIAEEVN